jgi:hypothetical protein
VLFCSNLEDTQERIIFKIIRKLVAIASEGLFIGCSAVGLIDNCPLIDYPPDLKMGITWRSYTVKEHGINNVYTNGSTRERLPTVLTVFLASS